MNASSSIPDRRFYRDTDRGMLGGVCAGVSEYFGFNLCVTRFLAVVAFFWTGGAAILAYLALVLLVPKRPTRRNDAPVDRQFQQALRSSPGQTMSDLRGRFQSLDRRLARLEKYITSSRYQLDREFRDLEDQPDRGRRR